MNIPLVSASKEPLILSFEVSRSPTENWWQYACYFPINDIQKKLSYFKYTLEFMRCDRKAIAACTNYDAVQMRLSIYQSIKGLMDSAFGSHLGVPGSTSGWGIIGTFSKNVNFSF